MFVLISSHSIPIDRPSDARMPPSPDQYVTYAPTCPFPGNNWNFSTCIPTQHCILLYIYLLLHIDYCYMRCFNSWPKDFNNKLPKVIIIIFFRRERIAIGVRIIPGADHEPHSPAVVISMI